MMPHAQYNNFGLQASFSDSPTFHSPESGFQNTRVRRQALKALDHVQRAHCGGKLRLGAGEPSPRQAAALQGALILELMADVTLQVPCLELYLALHLSSVAVNMKHCHALTRTVAPCRRRVRCCST